MIFTLMPFFLMDVLGARTTIIGIIEGIAESTSTLLRIFSGWLSDKVAKRKVFALLGYGLSTVAKPFMYWASSWGMVLGVRFTDRVGKGIRTSPRDALVADSSPAEERGKSFGFHRAMDTAGAVVGLGIAALVFFLTQREAMELALPTYQRIVLIGVIPAVLAVLILFLFVHEPKRVMDNSSRHSSGFQQTEDSQVGKNNLGATFWIFLGLLALFTLGNSSDAFLFLKARDVGASPFWILLMLVSFNIVYTVSSLPMGMLSDRVGRKRVIAFGWSVYVLVYLGFALAPAEWQLWPLFAVYGLYYGATEGVARALIADMVVAEKRGTAYGFYHTAVGITALPASIIAGWLWETFNPAMPFFFGAGLAALALIGLLFLPLGKITGSDSS
jgi:MFS family permease